MNEAVGVVENGRVKLPPSVKLPDGARVRVFWEDPDTSHPTIEREPLSEEDVLADIHWATGKNFSK